MMSKTIAVVSILISISLVIAVCLCQLLAPARTTQSCSTWTIQGVRKLRRPASCASMHAAFGCSCSMVRLHAVSMREQLTTHAALCIYGIACLPFKSISHFVMFLPLLLKSLLLGIFTRASAFKTGLPASVYVLLSIWLWKRIYHLLKRDTAPKHVKSQYICAEEAHSLSASRLLARVNAAFTCH